MIKKFFGVISLITLLAYIATDELSFLTNIEYIIGGIILSVLTLYLLNVSYKNIIKNIKNKEYVAGVKIKDFFKNYFSNYKGFLEKYINKKRPPFFVLSLFGLGSFVSFYVMEMEIYNQTSGIGGFLEFWFILLIVSVIIGYLYYVILGVIFNILVWLSGGKTNLLKSANISLYSGLSLYIAVIAFKVIETIILRNGMFTEKMSSAPVIMFFLIVLIGMIYRAYLNYKGAIIIQKTKKVRTIIFFMIMPIFIYIIIFANTLSYITNSEYLSTQKDDNNIAVEMLNKGDYEGAVNKFEDNLLDADRFEKVITYTNIAATHRATGEIDLAVDNYEKALELLSETDAEYYSLSGVINMLNKNLKEAIVNLKKSIELDEDNFTANNNLSLIYLGRVDPELKNLESALTYSKKAYEINNIDPSIIQNLAINYYELEMYGDAENPFKELIKIVPNNALSNYLLGMTLYKNENLRDSKKYLEKAIKLAPDLNTEEVQEILNS